MLKSTFLKFLSIIIVSRLITACTIPPANNQTNNQTPEPANSKIVHPDSITRSNLEKALDSIMAKNSSPDDASITATFLNQGKYDNGESYIAVRTKNDSLLVLTNPMPLKENEIKKLKKNVNNITLTFSKSGKIVKLLSMDFEPEK